jgi:small subunit ribosomal protein S16
LIRIRLARVGKKKQPTYRLVVAGQRAPRDGRFLEILGHYNPLKQPAELSFDADRTREWLAKGAQPSEAVAKLLAREGIGETPRRASKPAKPAGKGEAASKAEEAGPAATAAAEQPPAEQSEEASATAEAPAETPDEPADDASVSAGDDATEASEA